MPQPPYDSPEPPSDGSPHPFGGQPNPGEPVSGERTDPRGPIPRGPQDGKSTDPPRISPGARTFLMVYMAIGAVGLLVALIVGGYFGLREFSRWTGPKMANSMAVRSLPPGMPLYPGFTRIVGYNYHSTSSSTGGSRTSTRTVRIEFRSKDRLPTVGAWYESALQRQGYARTGRTADPEWYVFQRDGTSVTLTQSWVLFGRRSIVMVVEQTTGAAGPAAPVAPVAPAGPVGPRSPGVAPYPDPPPSPPPPPPPPGTAPQQDDRTASAAPSVIPS